MNLRDMTPKEKAQELVNVFYEVENKQLRYTSIAKESALAAANEIFNAVNMIAFDVVSICIAEWIIYWQQVKEEIEKL